MFAMMRRIAIVLLAVGITLSLPRTSGAQTTEKFPFLAAVTAEQTQVRAGADSRYYPFGSVRRNDLVQVVAEKAGWARVRAVGPAFDGFYGYLKFPTTEATRIQLDSTGTVGVTTGTTTRRTAAPVGASLAPAALAASSAPPTRPSRRSSSTRPPTAATARCATVPRRARACSICAMPTPTRTSSGSARRPTW